MQRKTAHACSLRAQVLQVWVVAPRCDLWCEEVARVSCGSSIAGGLQITDTLLEALADTTGAALQSSRQRA